MAAHVENPKDHSGLPTDHPRMVEAVKTALSRGLSKEEIVKRIGAEPEIIDAIRRDMK